MTTHLMHFLRSGTFIALISLGSLVILKAAETPATNGAAPVSTNAPVAQTTTTVTKIITNDDEDDVAPEKETKHSATIEIKGGHDKGNSELESILIPLAGIIATFGTPVLIVFFVCYFKYRRRQENLALAREYLNKGLPVPPQLLDPSQSSGGYTSPIDAVNRGQMDLRKGFRWTFIGLAIALALFVNDRHATDWGWGLIPMVIGIGFLISGGIELRHHRTVESSPTPPPPRSEPPL